MNKDIGTEEAIRRWDLYGETFTSAYGEKGDKHREILLNPDIFSLIDSLKDKKVLDAGCGEGYLSRMLARNGASVLGVDYSEKMVQLAMERTPRELNIRFRHGNCEDLYFLQDQSFDLIISNMVIHDLSNYEKALSEMYRLLADRGYFIFSILHPCFVTPDSGWVKSDNGRKLYWKVDHYFYEGAYDQAYPSGQQEKLIYFHRTLTNYVSAIVKTGFRIEAIVEPKPSDEMIKKYPSFEEDLRCSDFLVFKLSKG